MDKLRDNQYIILLLRIHYEIQVVDSDGVGYREVNYVTLDKAHRVTKKDKADLIENYVNIMTTKGDFYKILVVKRLIMEYWVKENNSGKTLQQLSSLKNIPKITNPVKNINKIDIKLNTMNIPLDRNYET
uniref:hypothetical protein n=1 Tax=Elmerina hispida TaxID=1245649 RepID=UPI0030015372|nr:hypothetical protein [Elmerina hispida]